MALSKQKKKEILEKIDGKLTGAGSVVFVSFRGVTVADVTLMRRTLTKAGVGYMVTKKTLAARALESKKYKGTAPVFPGELAIAWSADEIAPARGVYEFQKKFENRVSILGGIFEGTYMDKAGMTAIASIPPREILLGQFVNVINSPIQGLVVALSEIAKKRV